MDIVSKRSKKFSGMNLNVKCYTDNEKSKTPSLATSDSAGYDLYAAESRTIMPRSLGAVSLEMRFAIPRGFYGKKFSRSGLLIEHLITAEGGLIDSGNRGIVKVLLFNHSGKPFTVNVGDRIAQMIFMKKFDAISEEFG